MWSFIKSNELSRKTQTIHPQDNYETHATIKRALTR